MASISGVNRLIEVSTPLGADVLVPVALSGQEELSRLFNFQLDMVSHDDSIAAPDIVGKNVTVTVKRTEGDPRYFNGFVSRFAVVGKRGDLTRYRAELVPFLWFLEQTTDCRIFQEQTLQEIIEQIFGEYGFSDFESGQIKGGADLHPPWEYCVQYRETDFNFVSRLMEREGIFYYFRHEDGKHVLVMGDQKGTYVGCAEDEVEYNELPDAMPETGNITSWEHNYEFRPGKVSQTDFNFETPSNSLLTNEASVVDLPGISKYEKYDYPGQYYDKSVGQAYTKIRMEEEEVPHNMVSGESTCKSFHPGGTFTLSRHDAQPAEEGQSYVIRSIRHLASNAPDSTAGGAGEDYQNTFTAIPDSVTFRPPRSTRKPVVQGPQTATITGPPGEEIWPDKYGRVKVQFHWDREGQRDDKSSCWMRVSQAYGGKGWGAMCIPRIGQEVIVDCLEGDPDRPIITGRVYNAEAMPPYALPGEKVVSGLKSNSSPGGGGYNEFIMNDTKGNELIRLHGQFDMDSTIENDLREHVLNNRSRDVAVDETVSVGSNQKIDVGADQTYSIGANQSGTVGADKTLKIGANHTETIGSSMTINVGSNLTETVAINYAETVGAAMELTVGGLMMMSVGAIMTQSVGGAFVLSVGAYSKEAVSASKSVSVGGGLKVNVGGANSVAVGGAYTLNAAKIGLEANSEIVLKTGSAEIVLKSGGDITIKGTEITLKASGKIGAKAGGDVVIKGANVLQN